MKTSGALLIIGAGVAAYFYLRARAAGRLLFFPGNVQGMAFEGATPVAYLDFIVQNTSNADIVLNSVAGNAYANGYLVGNISQFQPQVIRGNSEIRFPVSVRFMLIGIVNDIITAFQTGSFHQDIQIEGTANAEGIPVRLDLKFNV